MAKKPAARPSAKAKKPAKKPAKKSAKKFATKPAPKPATKSATKPATKHAKKSATKQARRPAPATARKPVKTPVKKTASRPSAAKPARVQARKPAPAAPEALRPPKMVKCPFDKKQLLAFRVALLEMRSSRIGDKENREKEALKAAGQDVSVDHMADFGSDNYEQEFTLGLLEQDIETLRDINDALERIREGTFGLCEECIKPVARARLKVIPYARLCVDCKMKEE